MRGYNKRIFHLKNTGSYIFDEALFIVKGSCDSSSLTKSDMVLEANRIIEESLKDGVPLPRGEGGSFLKRILIPFFLGVLTAATVALFVLLLV